MRHSVAACIALVAAATCVEPAWAANFPLELINIRAGMSGSNRLARAYPRLEYNVRAAVIGGLYPYTYSLSDAPPGMRIDPRTGEIVWPDPQASATPRITVVDSEGTRVSATWTITVGPEGFRFLDAAAGRPAPANGCTSNCGAGTADSPWRTISDAVRSGVAGEFLYFRSGTYRVTDLPRTSVGDVWERVELSSASHPVVWLAYPGHNPVLDFDYRPGSENGPLIRFSGPNVHLEGLEAINARYIGFQYISGTGAGPTFRRMRMHRLGPGLDGTNAGFIMTTTNPTPTDFMVVQDCEFYDITGNATTLKIYAQRKMLIEDSIHHDTTVGIELKDDVRQFTVRGNTFYAVPQHALGGNMHENTTSGEMLFNNARASLALDLNQDGMASRIYVYRNTFMGRVQVRNTDSADGPFFLSNNVIVNGDAGTPAGSHVSHSSVSAPDRIILSNNLTGFPSDNIVDGNGNLTPAHASSIGVHGHQLGTGSQTLRPSTPARLQILPPQ